MLETFETIHVDFPDFADIRMVVYRASRVVVINDAAPADGLVCLKQA